MSGSVQAPGVAEMIKKSMLIVIFGLLFSVAGSAIGGGDAAAGQIKASGCAGCHGADGAGIGDNPSLAGLDYEGLVSSMASYRSKDREDMMMNMLFASMSDEDIADLAAYFSSVASQ